MRAHRSTLPLVCLSLAATTAWAHDTEEAILHASDAAPGDLFGRALDLSHHDLIGGSPGADVVGSDSGAAYVFIEDLVLGWVEEQKLVPAIPASGDRFGAAVGIHGDVAVVGAPNHDANGSDSGAVYVFTRAAGVWSEVQILLPPPASDGAAFGSSIALSHDYLVIGSPENLPGGDGRGAVYVYADVGGVWTLETTLTSSDGAPGHLFGTSVSTFEATVAVGAMLAPGASPATGAAYVFDKSGGVWSQTAKLFSGQSNASDFYGVSVGLFQDNILAVGAPGNDFAGVNAGAAYSYLRQNGTWKLLGPIRRGAQPGDLFGGSVAYSYKVFLSGARMSDGGASNAGEAWMWYDNAPFGYGLEIWVSSEPSPDEFLGAAVDVDECTMLAGAPGHDGNAGAIYVFVVAEALSTNLNGSGVNPQILATDPLAPPLLGQIWNINIDATGIPGAAVTQLFGVRSLLPDPVTIGIGEILINRGSGLVFSTLQVGSGLTTHSIQIPDDPWLIGLQVNLQGVVREGVTGLPAIALSNAESNRIGCHLE